MAEISFFENESNPVLLVNEQKSMLDYPEGELADQVFCSAEVRMQQKRKGIMDAVIAASPMIAEAVKGLRKTQRLKLVFSEDTKDKLAKGVYRLMKCSDSDGMFKAIVVNSKGKIKEIASLRWDTVFQGIDVSKLLSSMQGIMIQRNLIEITNHLEYMSKSLEDILIGQYNDRLAMFYAGEAIYREALATSDIERKRLLSSAAIVSLTNSIATLQTSLEYEIKGVCEKYNGEKKKFIKISSEELKSKMYLINSSFQAIHKAISLKTAIYYEEGEYAALTTALSAYKAFLERSLNDRRVQILYQADPTDKCIDGIWASRKKDLPESIEKVKKLLSEPTEYAIEMKKEDLK